MKKWYIIVFAIVFVLALGGFFFFRSSTIYSAQAVAAAKGSDIGIAPFTDRVDFGDIPQGSTISKTVVLDNLGGNDNQVRLFILGSIGNFITVDPGDSFTIPAEKSQDVNLTFTMPESASVGEKFTGRIIIFRLPW